MGSSQHANEAGQPGASVLDMSGETVAVVGGGPSLRDFRLDRKRFGRAIVVNSGCRNLAPYASAHDVLYFTDNSWAEEFGDAIADWPGLVLTSSRTAADRIGRRARFVDVTELTIFVGAMSDSVQASSAHVAACLAAKFGAARILLFAMECRAVGGATHGHSDYSQAQDLPFSQRFIPGWRGLAPSFKRLGVDVVNVTPCSAIDCFRLG